MPLPANITEPQFPDFLQNDTLVFAARPVAGGRLEIYRINEDGSGLACLTCGVAPSVTADLSKPFVFRDGSDRVLVRVGV